MILIVDASVAIKWFVKENLHDEALKLLQHYDRLQAPELIVAELTNVVWKKRLRREITKGQAQTIVAAIPNCISVLYPILLDHERTLEIAVFLEHPAYDCLYLACAAMRLAKAMNSSRVIDPAERVRISRNSASSERLLALARSFRRKTTSSSRLRIVTLAMVLSSRLVAWAHLRVIAK